MQDDEFPPLNADFDNTDEDFYPFPCKKFFLLYCYAHSVMCNTSALEEGMVRYDAESKCDVFVQYPILFVAWHNPRASQFCHHMGGSAIYFCRLCEVR